MAVTAKVEPIERDVRLIIDETLSPAAQSRMIADGAREFIEEADGINRRILGRIPPRRVFVDGREGAALDTVRVRGVIVAEWELVIDLLVYIATELQAVSPFKSGRYQRSHTLFADGREVPIGKTIPIADEYVFLSDVEYSIKIEGVPGRKPQSRQAPRGVYQITAQKSNRQMGNIARCRFEWRKPYRGSFVTGHEGNKSDGRVPAIVVTLRK